MCALEGGWGGAFATRARVITRRVRMSFLSKPIFSNSCLAWSIVHRLDVDVSMHRIYNDTGYSIQLIQ